MPRDLFGDVTRPSISIGNRKWYTVPVSLLSHSIILAMFLVLPILAAPSMPQVFADNDLDPDHHARSANAAAAASAEATRHRRTPTGPERCADRGADRHQSREARS